MSGPQYSLRNGVKIIEKQAGVFLCSSFPLKAVALNERQRALLHSLESWPGQDLDQVHREFFSDQCKDRLESYLDRLVKAGFLQQRGIRDDLALPIVSIVIPVRNRPNDIERCIESLLALDYPRDKLEIVVVDDASDDQTLEVVRRFPVIVRSQTTNQGASACRNLGAKDARGELLFFIDSDCAVAPEALRELVTAFRNTEVGACGGMVESMETQSGLDRYEQVKSSLRMGSAPKDSTGGDPFFYVPSCGMAVRKEAFVRVGGFNPELKVGEDVDLCWRLIDGGYIVDYRPSARIYHRHRNTLGQFCRRRFDYGTSEPILQKLHTTRRKTFRIWPRSSLFWAMVVAALVFKSAALGLPALGWLAVDAFLRWRNARKAGLGLSYGAPLKATARAHLSFLYHVFSFFSRYYLVLTFPLAVISPAAAGAIWLAHCVTGVVQFFVTKPKMNLVLFLCYFSLEQLSYQAGVWYECFKLNAYAPIYPKVCFKQT